MIIAKFLAPSQTNLNVGYCSSNFARLIQTWSWIFLTNFTLHENVSEDAFILHIHDSLLQALMKDIGSNWTLNVSSECYMFRIFKLKDKNWSTEYSKKWWIQKWGLHWKTICYKLWNEGSLKKPLVHSFLLPSHW